MKKLLAVLILLCVAAPATYAAPLVTFEVTLYEDAGCLTETGTGWLRFEDDLELDTFYKFSQLKDFTWGFDTTGILPGLWSSELGHTAGWWANREGIIISASEGGRILRFQDATYDPPIPGMAAEFFKPNSCQDQVSWPEALRFYNNGDWNIYDPCTNTWTAGECYTVVEVDGDDDGVGDSVDLCPATLIPESVPTVRLGRNRWALVHGDFIFDTNAPKGNGPGRSYTTTDTAGCSCEQIIAAQDLGKGHTKFGCSISVMDEWVALVNE